MPEAVTELARGFRDIAAAGLPNYPMETRAAGFRNATLILINWWKELPVEAPHFRPVAVPDHLPEGAATAMASTLDAHPFTPELFRAMLLPMLRLYTIGFNWLKGRCPDNWQEETICRAAQDGVVMYQVAEG